MTAILSTRLDEHVRALETLGLERAREAFLVHECSACDAVLDYVDALEHAAHDDAIKLPPPPDCLAAHVAAVARVAHLRLALSPDLRRRVDAFSSVFAGLVELEAVPLEAPLAAALASPRSPALESPRVLRPMNIQVPPSRNRSFAFVAALAAALLAGLLGWWLLSPAPSDTPDVTAPPHSGRACDPDALRRGIAQVRELRAAHPAWIGDHGLGAAPAMKALTDACPDLQDDLRQRLEAFVSVSVDQRATRLSRGLPERSAEYEALLGRVCADQSVFEEAARMQPHERGLAILQRCRLQEAGLGDDTEVVYGQLGVTGFVLHRWLLDDGIEPELARDAVLSWVHPDLERTASPRVPRLARVAPMNDGILVRLENEAVSLPGGSKLPLTGSRVADTNALGTWMKTQLDAAFEDELAVVVVEADAAAPAAGLVDIADVARVLEVDSVGVLVRADNGLVGVEYVHTLRDDIVPTHVLTVSGGKHRIIDARGDTILADADTDALDRWAASVAEPESVTLAIDVRGVTVQQLVDLQATLRGSACSPLDVSLGEEDPSCRPFAVGISGR